MTSMKFALVFVALFATCMAVNQTWGVRNNTNWLLLSEGVVRYPINNSQTSVQVVYPKAGQTNTRKITAIYYYDKFTNGTGAYAEIWSGGVGSTFVTLNIKSQFSRGINSTVEIFGQ